MTKRKQLLLMSEAEEIQRAFKVCDKDEDGALTKQELIMYVHDYTVL